MFRLRSFRMSLLLIVLMVPIIFVPVANAKPLADGFNFLPGCTGEYFNNTTVTGSPVMVRTDPALNFFWPENVSPGPGVSGNNYSVRWTCSLYVATTGNYTFNILTDDGMNLLLDGNLLIWAFYDQGPTGYTTTTTVSAGWHTVKVEYYNRWQAGTAQVLSTMVATPAPAPTAIPPAVSNVWHGQYFSNINLSGTPTFVRDDPLLNFNWGEGSPGGGIPIDYFSIKWDSTQTVPTTGNYTISATSDDGVRVWVDGLLTIDAWYDHAPTTFIATRYLTAGTHTVHVEYYDRTLGAMINVQIGSGSAPPPPPTTPPVSTATEAVTDDLGPGWQAGGIGGWRSSPIGINSHSFWTLNNTFTAYGYNWARWYPFLTGAGFYEVLAYIPDNLGTTLNARYWIHHNNRYDVAPRAQGFYHDQWVSLGTYYFSATGGEYVSLADVTYECFLCRTVVFDAVRFVPR